MIPLRDLNPTRGVPAVTIAIITANTLVFLATMSDLDAAAVHYGAIAFHYTGYAPAMPFHGMEPIADDGHRVLRAFSHMWLHGGLMHILGNMWFLWVFGDNVEERLGRGRFFALYMLSGFVSLAAQVVSAPDFGMPMIGASGAVSGVLGAYVMLYPRAQVLTLLPIGWLFLTVVWPAFAFLGVWFGLQVLQGMLAPAGMGGVAWWAHAGGFVVGALLARPLALPARPAIRVDVRRPR